MSSDQLEDSELPSLAFYPRSLLFTAHRNLSLIAMALGLRTLRQSSTLCSQLAVQLETGLLPDLASGG